MLQAQTVKQVFCDHRSNYWKTLKAGAWEEKKNKKLIFSVVIVSARIRCHEYRIMRIIVGVQIAWLLSIHQICQRYGFKCVFRTSYFSFLLGSIYSNRQWSIRIEMPVFFFGLCGWKEQWNLSSFFFFWLSWLMGILARNWSKIDLILLSQGRNRPVSNFSKILWMWHAQCSRYIHCTSTILYMDRARSNVLIKISRSLSNFCSNSHISDKIQNQSEFNLPYDLWWMSIWRISMLNIEHVLTAKCK